MWRSSTSMVNRLKPRQMSSDPCNQPAAAAQLASFASGIVQGRKNLAGQADHALQPPRL